MSRISDALGPERLGRLAARVRRLPGGAEAIGAFDRARSRRIERSDDAAELAKSRWRGALPDPHLTWGIDELSGAAFVEAAERHGAFGGTVLEIGPGYGRLLTAALDRGVEFERWIALDISNDVVRHMAERFSDPRVEAREGDIEAVRLSERPDAVLSSLTLKHLYPDFGAALANLRRSLAPGAIVVFDLIEGDRRYFQHDGRTYVRAYRRTEVDEILVRSGLERVAFDEVAHDPEHVRLLVVARAA